MAKKQYLGWFTSSEVRERKKAAGISISTTQQQRNAALLNDIYDQLESQLPPGMLRGMPYL
jgi:hypothetical protein